MYCQPNRRRTRQQYHSPRPTDGAVADRHHAPAPASESSRTSASRSSLRRISQILACRRRSRAALRSGRSRRPSGSRPGRSSVLLSPGAGRWGPSRGARRRIRGTVTTDRITVNSERRSRITPASLLSEQAGASEDAERRRGAPDLSLLNPAVGIKLEELGGGGKPLAPLFRSSRAIEHAWTEWERSMDVRRGQAACSS